jgi:nucleoside-diphosphate-sugar epimerase
LRRLRLLRRSSPVPTVPPPGPRHVLVTGGAGYVGTALCRVLVDRGHTVRVFDQVPQESLGGCQSVVGDVVTEADWKPALEGVDTVVHLAAAGWAEVEKQPTASPVNVVGVNQLVSQRRHEQTVIYASTVGVYGRVRRGVCDEKVRPRPLTRYAAQKLEAERILRRRGNCIIYRMAMSFGAPEGPDSFVGRMVDDAMRDGSVHVPYPEEMRRCIHVTDTARALAHAVEHCDTMRGKTYNCGNSRAQVTRRELAEAISRITGCEVVAGQDDRPPGRDYLVSFARLEATGFAPEVSLDDGLRELVATRG